MSFQNANRFNVDGSTFYEVRGNLIIHYPPSPGLTPSSPPNIVVSPPNIVVSPPDLVASPPSPVHSLPSPVAQPYQRVQNGHSKAKSSQEEAVKMLARAYGSPKDSWDNSAWTQEPIGRYKVVFESTGVGAQLEWDGSTWSTFAAHQDSKLLMPWLASRRGVEEFPEDGPRNCRVIVFDCISYSVSYMRILTIDEERRTALSQEIFYNTSFRGIRSIGYDNDGYVLVEGLTGRLGPVSLGCMYSRLWFQTKEEADEFCTILTEGQKGDKRKKSSSTPAPIRPTPSPIPVRKDTKQKSSQEEAVKMLARAYRSPKDDWNGSAWLEAPIERYKVVFETTNVGGQLQWDSSTWSRLAADPDAKLWMPWLASRPDVEDFPADGPGNCRVIVFDCISYSVPYMRVLTLDEDRRTALTQDIFYNTSFRGIRSIRYDNDGYVLVEGLTGQLGPVFLGGMYSRLWFQTKEEADEFCTILAAGQKRNKTKKTSSTPAPKPPASTPKPVQDYPSTRSLQTTRQKSSQEEAVKMLARAYRSPKDSWDGSAWMEDPIDRYKVVFETTKVGAQLQWESRTWATLNDDDDSKLWMPWLASRRDVEDFPADGPRNCRVIVFDCISYSVPYMRVLTIDEDRRAALAQNVFYNTSFKGVRSARDNNDGYVVVEGLTGKIGPLFLGCMYSRLWFETGAEAAEFCRILAEGQKRCDEHSKAKAGKAAGSQRKPSAIQHIPAAVDTCQKSSQEEVVKMLARASNSPTDTWDGKPWNAEPIGRYKVIFETTKVGAQLEWDSEDWRTLATDDDSELYMPWLASRPGVEDFPANGPSNCRLFVIDCVSYSVPYLRVMIIDEDRNITLNQEVFYNTIFRGIRSIEDDNDGYVVVEGLGFDIGPLTSGCGCSRLWFQTKAEADKFCEILAAGQKKCDEYKNVKAAKAAAIQSKPPVVQPIPAAVDTSQKSSQEEVVKMLATACNSPEDGWDGNPWDEEPIGRYKVVFETTKVGAQLEWDSEDWRTLATDDDSELYMPWLASRPGVEDFPANGPSNCRVLVIDCISYDVPYLRILTVDEDRHTTLSQEVFYNTSFRGIRSIGDDNDGYVVVEGLGFDIGPLTSGCGCSRLWFQTKAEADKFCEILAEGQRKCDAHET